MGGLVTEVALPVFDDWDDRARFRSVPFDKIDVTAYNGDVLLQYQTPNGAWQPLAGQMVRRGNFRSIPGLSTVFPPGPLAVQFKRATAGVPAVVDFDLYSTDG